MGGWIGCKNGAIFPASSPVSPPLPSSAFLEKVASKSSLSSSSPSGFSTSVQEPWSGLPSNNACKDVDIDSEGPAQFFDKVADEVPTSTIGSLPQWTTIPSCPEVHVMEPHASQAEIDGVVAAMSASGAFAPEPQQPLNPSPVCGIAFNFCD